MVLEQIFELEFLPTSNGFRVPRGCHAALEQIRINWAGISWFLEFDIRKRFDGVNKNRLVSIINEKIDDQMFLDLIHKLFNAGVIGSKITNSTIVSEIMQDSIISPILSNIYLHKIDLEVSQIQKEFEAGNTRRLSNAYCNLTRAHRTKDFQSLPIERRVAIMRKKLSDTRKLNLTRTDWGDPNFRRIRYVRYIDTFLFGIAGPRELVTHIRKRITNFVKSNLKLELTGGRITHVASGKVSFLGMDIYGISNSKFLGRIGKSLEKRKRMRNRLMLLRKNTKDKILRALQMSFKKIVLNKDSQLLKNSSELKMKFQAIKESIISDKGFYGLSVKSYKDFINSLYSTHDFVPTFLKSALMTLESELDNWKKSLGEVSSSFKQQYKELFGRFEALPLQIKAPLSVLRKKLRLRGILSKSNKPTPANKLVTQADAIIVSWFCGIGEGFLNYYRCCNNFYKVKAYVDYFVRWSAIHTLASKHGISCRKVINKWSLDLRILDSDGFQLALLPNSNNIKSMNRKFLTDINDNAGLRILDTISHKR